MAMARKFVCDNCAHEIEAWDDGNPYYIDEAGAKQYAYHPDHQRLARCVGNDRDHLCLDCGALFRIDSLAPVDSCPTCSSLNFGATVDLDQKRCPYCKEGYFRFDPDFFCIS